MEAGHEFFAPFPYRIGYTYKPEPYQVLDQNTLVVDRILITVYQGVCHPKNP